MSLTNFNTLVWIWIAVALALVPIQLIFTAPYGRHTRKGWGPLIDNRLGWILMELVSPVVFAWFFLDGMRGSRDNASVVSTTTPMWIFFAFWLLHYLNRSIIFPLRIHTAGKKMPISIVFSAAFFNVMNGFVNGYGLGTALEPYPESWLMDPRFVIGALLMVTGAAINLWADNRLIHLRKPGETQYVIPRGGLFERISCPNLFGEIIEWCGFAVMCWSLPALSFAIWTAANLIPRALAHHRWYRGHFADYPAERKAVIPGIL